MSRLVSISLDLDMPGKMAILNMDDLSFEVIDVDSDVHGQGYGYIRRLLDGNQRLIALFSESGRLYFYYGEILDLTTKHYRFELKQGFYKDELTVFKDGKPMASLKFKRAITNSEVVEDVVEMFRQEKGLDERLRQRIEFFSETDAIKRQKIIEKEISKAP